MIILYKGGGSSDFDLISPTYEKHDLEVLKFNVAKILTARGEAEATKLLKRIPFIIYNGTNNFCDEFCVLHAEVPLELYEELRNIDQSHFASIASCISEIGPYIRFVTVALKLRDPIDEKMQHKSIGLNDKEINKLVYRYIGVNKGYLGDFSYRSHHNFYIDLDLDIDPNEYKGNTTRERFINIIKTNPPYVQAKILEGILERYPVESSELRTKERYEEIQSWIIRLKNQSNIDISAPQITSDIVYRALADAEELITSRGATSGIDRMHTALHGYLKFVCDQSNIEVSKDASITKLYKFIREKHPAFSDLGPRSEDITKVLNALATVIDSLNPIRNHGSIAHPNEDVLDEPEAILVINAIRTLLNYFDVRIKNSANKD